MFVFLKQPLLTCNTNFVQQIWTQILFIFVFDKSCFHAINIWVAKDFDIIIIQFVIVQ